MEKDIYEFWERLSQLAKSKGLPIKQASEIKGLSYHAVLNKKVEGKRPNIEVISALAQVYGVSIDYLILGIGCVNNGDSVKIAPDEEMIIKEYRSLDDFHKARIYTAILDAKQDMFAQRLKKESSTSGSMVG